MADLDYGELRVYPGSYDRYMTAATQARERMQADNAKKKAKIAELNAFVSRFSANASKSKQATSRAKQIEKIELVDIKPSSRQNPYIRFNQEKKLHRLALEVKGLSKSYDEELFSNLDLTVEVGERIAIIGPNGIGKSTLMKCLMGEEALSGGTIKWSENAQLGYYAQDHARDFEGGESLYDWMAQWGKPEDDEQVIRGTLGRLLFSQKEIEKSVSIISGGEQGRMLFGKLMLQTPNIMLLDEPTNHLDMESIESLNLALENYPGTLLFVSHDREFVSSLATRIIELTPTGIVDYHGTYEDYLLKQEAG
jgi:ATPase subunit of ABC transporter with duplicated ATPase domains